LEKNVADRLTALEMVRRTSQPWPNRIVECVTQTNQLLLDMPFIKCNNGTYHTFTRRMILTNASVRSYYEGTKTVATQTKQVDEPTALFQAVAEIDADMADDTGDAAATQRTESIGVINGMGIQQARNMIYGRRDPDQKNGLDGFATRLAKLGDKVFDMGGTGSNLTSLYLCALGDMFLHGIYPESSGMVGVSVEREGKQTEKDENGGKYQVYRTYYKHRYGIALEDPRSIIRLANIPADIDPEELVDTVLSKGRRLPEGASTYVLYGNYTVLDIIDKAAYKKGNVIYPTTDPWGRPLTMLRNFRVRTVEAILDTETAIT
jgi:hypothetical protein